MDFTKFDRILWRLIGIGILALCVLAGIFGLVTTREIFRENHPKHADISPPSENKDLPPLMLGNFEEVKGQDALLLPLTRDRSSGIRAYSSGPYYYQNVRNYFLYHVNKNSGRWIWPKNENVISSQFSVFQSLGKSDNAKAVGFVFQVVEAKEKKDQSEDGKVSVEYFDLSKDMLFSVVKNVDRVVGVKQISAKEILVIYSRAGEGYLLTFHLDKFAPGLEKKIENP